jgi:hypothetical protein
MLMLSHIFCSCLQLQLWATIAGTPSRSASVLKLRCTHFAVLLTTKQPPDKIKLYFPLHLRHFISAIPILKRIGCQPVQDAGTRTPQLLILIYTWDTWSHYRWHKTCQHHQMLFFCWIYVAPTMPATYSLRRVGLFWLFILLRTARPPDTLKERPSLARDLCDWAILFIGACNLSTSLRLEALHCSLDCTYSSKFV